jgi:hypothetical protein
MLLKLDRRELLFHLKLGWAWNFSPVSLFGLARVQEKALNWISRLDSHRRSIQHSTQHG